MTASRTPQALRGKALSSGAAGHSADIGQPSRAASVAFIRSWPLSILCLCFFPLLLGLGNWQLQRAQEKQQILHDIDVRLSAQPARISELRQAQTYTPVRLLGFYTDEYFYLDNRTRNGRTGYEILQVFETNSGSGRTRWLINRGWLAAGTDRGQLPDVAYPLAAKVITGFLYPVPQTTQTEGGNSSIEPHGRIQQLDAALADRLNLTRSSWHIRLSADSDTAFVTDWQLVNVKPQKHHGYALQWFSMASALVVLWLLAATNVRLIVRQKWFKKTAKQT